MALDDRDTSQMARIVAGAQVLMEAHQDNPHAERQGRRISAKGLWDGWSEVLDIAERARHTDIPAARSKITSSERIKAAAEVMREQIPGAIKDIAKGLPIFEELHHRFLSIAKELSQRR